MLRIGVSGLLAMQRALATTANNISNASTEGFNRQRVSFAERTPDFMGGNFLGTGVQVSGIERVFDRFLAGEVRNALSGQGRLETFSDLAGRVGNLLGGESSGISQGMQSFAGALAGLANDPSSLPVRQVALTEAQALAQRFNRLDSQLLGMEREVAGRVSGTVQEINGLASAIAQLNQQIVSAQAGGDPNALLDQRDQLISELSSKIDVSTVDQGDGVINVFIGTGQNLVLGAQANALSVGSGAFGPQTQEIRLGNTLVTKQLSGGELGGLLEFRSQVLEPARSELGLMAVAMATEFNRINREGMDLNGNLGGDLFSIGVPQVLNGSGNTGGAELSVGISDPSQLTGADYRLDFDGSNYALTNISTGQAVSLSAAQQTDLQNGDAIVVDGLSFQISGSPAAGDQFLTRPTLNAAGAIKSLITDPALLAAAAPVRAMASLDNIGNASISFGSVGDVSNPALLDPVTIRFIDPDNFELLDPDGNLLAGPLPFTPGEDISFNGWVVQIDGAPQTGDRFTVEANSGGVGDNRNALRLAALFEQDLLGNGSTSLFASADALVAQVGSVTAASNTALGAQRALLESSLAAQQAVSGVNLDEEAANLVRFQQAYEANAQIIRVADNIFQSLLAAVR